MRFYEQHPYWVRKDDPTCIVVIREVSDITRLWDPKADNSLVVQRLDKSGYVSERYMEQRFRREFEIFTPPVSRVRRIETTWWRSKLTPADFVQIFEILPWKGPKQPVSVRYGRSDRSVILGEATEDDFLREYEPSGPPPDPGTAWGKVWADD